MKKMLSLLAGVLFALSVSAATEVHVPMYRVTVGSSNITYQLLNDDMTRMFVFVVDSISAGATDVEFGRTYTLGKGLNQYSYWLEQSTYSYSLFTAASFKVSKNEAGKVRIDAQAKDQNGDEWILLYDEAAIPEMPKGGTFVADTVTTQSDFDLGVVQYALETENPPFAFVFNFKLQDGKKDLESGVTYTERDLHDSFESVGYYYYAPDIHYTSLEFKKTVAEDESYTIVATVVDEDGNTWHLSGSQVAPPDPTQAHLEYDTQSEDFDHTFTSFRPAMSNIASGSVVLQVTDTENMLGAYIHFWTIEGAESLTPGVYPIESSKYPGTVNASEGVTSQGVTPSIAYTLAESNGELLPNRLWMLVTGTVTVREDGSIEVNALNSYGRTVHLLFSNASEEDVENVRAGENKVLKVLQNGQVVIIQGNRKFSILGNRSY